MLLPSATGLGGVIVERPEHCTDLYSKLKFCRSNLVPLPPSFSKCDFTDHTCQLVAVCGNPSICRYSQRGGCSRSCSTDHECVYAYRTIVYCKISSLIATRDLNLSLCCQCCTWERVGYEERSCIKYCRSWSNRWVYVRPVIFDVSVSSS